MDAMRGMQTLMHVPLMELIARTDFLEKIPAETAANLHAFHSQMEKAYDAFRTPGDLCGKAKDLLDGIGYLDGLVRMYKPRTDASMRSLDPFVRSATV